MALARLCMSGQGRWLHVCAWCGAIRAVLSRFLRVVLHCHALQVKNALQAVLRAFMGYRGLRGFVSHACVVCVHGACACVGACVCVRRYACAWVRVCRRVYGCACVHA